MKTLSITTPFSGGVTIIPNKFVEQHMIHANGEFVKIYLYLMYASEHQKELSPSEIADALSCTESDVLRALRYWEREGLLSVQEVYSETHPAASEIAAANINVAKEDTLNSNPSNNNASNINESKSNESKSNESKSNELENNELISAKPHNAADAIKEYKPLTTERVKQLKENAAIAELLFIAQQYMGKLLTPTETNKILFFYEELQFSTDLIEYLIEYCVNKGHKNIHYIEKVAFAWKEEGIKTVEAAKKSGSCYHKDYYTILKALGVRGRGPIDAEITIMNTWLQEYGFTLDIITEACTRTILATKQPSLQYTDRILQVWKESGVHSISDVKKLDLEYEKNKAVQNKTEQDQSEQPKSESYRSEKSEPNHSGQVRKTSKSSNRFSNFEQRSYDYADLESQLLNH